MARLLACDWDAREVRLLSAEIRSGKVVSAQAVCARIETRAQTEDDEREAIVAAIRKAAEGLGKQRSKTIVGIDRRYVETVELTLPPARDAELPQLVRTQVLGEMTSVGENDPIDFLPLDADTGQSRRVAAFALVGASGEQVHSVLSQAGLHCAQLVFRPVANLLAVCENVAPTSGAVLTVVPFHCEADIAVYLQDRIVCWRTIRIPEGDAEQFRNRLAVEVCRTAAAAQHHLEEGRGIDRVVVFGDERDSATPIDELRQSFRCEVVLIDPLEELVESADRKSLAVGRFAPLVGMLRREVSGASQPVDLLHPRRPPRPANRRRRSALAAAAASFIVLLFAYQTWAQLAEQDEEISQLAQRRQQLDGLLDRAAKPRKTARAIEQWLATDICWLNELRTLSAEFPSAREMTIARLTAGQGQGKGGIIDLQGAARTADGVREMEQNLRGPFDEPRSRNIYQREAGGPFGWHFETSLFVPKRERPAMPTASGTATRSH